MSIPLANYKDEFECFRALFSPECDKRILFLRGSAGRGKTTLLRRGLDVPPGQAVCVPLQFRESTVGVAEILDRTGECIGWNKLPGFTRQVASLSGTPSVKIDKNWLAGINNHIQVALHVARVDDEKQRRFALTRSLFADLALMANTVVFAFDTFERAIDEVRDWVAGPFLARAARVPYVRVVIAGQEVPDANNIEWGEVCRICELRGVPEAKHWVPVMAEMGRVIPARNIDEQDWLSVACFALKGDPKAIFELIEGLDSR